LTVAAEIASSADAEMVAAVTSILGTLRVGEASATVGKLTAKQQGSNASYWTVFLVLVFGGWIAGLGVSFLLSKGGSPSYGTGGLLGVMIGAATFLMILGPLTRARFQKNFQARHHTLDLPFRMEISSDHLIYEVGGVTQLANWAAVDELCESHDYWIFLVQTHWMFAPKRFFESTDEERQFLREALALMTPEARLRSTEAERFVEAA
jgi:hypothetical protein